MSFAIGQFSAEEHLCGDRRFEVPGRVHHVRSHHGLKIVGTGQGLPFLLDGGAELPRRVPQHFPRAQPQHPQGKRRDRLYPPAEVGDASAAMAFPWSVSVAASFGGPKISD